MSAIRAVLTDIEGTTTPIAFVHRVLFPYARQALPSLVGRRADEKPVADALAEVRRLAPDADPLTRLLGWMDEDAKIGPLKTLQGLVWRDGYEAGLLKAEIYPDVSPALRSWTEAGLRIAVYSSGSVEAQHLIFRNGPDGDLTALFDGFFDTGVGAKRDTNSYRTIAGRLGLPPDEILFLSDVEAELDAAAEAGLRCCQLVRPEDGTVASSRHPVAPDFAAVAARFGLPAASSVTPAAVPSAAPTAA
ncbi:acireductone synthase [Acetobacteraceae bacterium KSS8]|uniref:Enolase-phosphatase E1 n=1 Tax=Endosaccharibacter trunci TaxID=2812733 RepID=A0ABT1W6A0_9PROT|nr:acireductone synthase [Acetobacteraceae bacterium KSS8]